VGGVGGIGSAGPNHNPAWDGPSSRGNSNSGTKKSTSPLKKSPKKNKPREGRTGSAVWTVEQWLKRG